MEKIILCEIVSLSELENGCIAGNKHFADLVGLNIRRTQVYMQHLEELEYIKREYTYKENSKEIQKRIIIPTYRWCRKMHGGGAEKCADKNTVFKENNNNVVMEFLSKQKSNVYDFSKIDDYFKRLRLQLARVCLKKLGCSEEETVEISDVIIGYYLKYRNTFEEHHPFLIDSELIRCIQYMRYDENLYGFEYDTCMDIFEQYFMTDFSWRVDYHLSHFCSEEIIQNRAYEIGN